MRSVCSTPGVSLRVLPKSSEATRKSSASEFSFGMGCSSKEDGWPYRHISSIRTGSATRFVEPTRMKMPAPPPRAGSKSAADSDWGGSQSRGPPFSRRHDFARRHQLGRDAIRSDISAIGEHHRVRKEAGWQLLTPRQAPSVDLEGHDYISEPVRRLPL